MTFLSNASLPQDAGQGRPDAPDDLLRAIVQRLVQETIQAEFDQFMGAAPFKRGPRRSGEFVEIASAAHRRIAAASCLSGS